MKVRSVTIVIMLSKKTPFWDVGVEALSSKKMGNSKKMCDPSPECTTQSGTKLVGGFNPSEKY